MSDKEPLAWSYHLVDKCKVKSRKTSITKKYKKCEVEERMRSFVFEVGGRSQERLPEKRSLRALTIHILT